ncbi:N-acetyl-1-D-myo-inositol-2-amino-2-deoxy-alpha-D-glucopyranoside deacetylase [Corynebacterium sp. CCM 9185]|uniref:1D-myo-inositol 2-acetamido-2-deoxy-alpha-D-glucopyranoside deacetylase n=1 Tax=Corynebacterium marambiense TaxID=2765364 RepID=A0ABS0VTL7_9CORY|nr:N-acetyl-1-D-myo-inositol-2-amino-2-deoxy-alpha-D-glucopyranoside deacetylase [Corynebacterium marambiense]MBI9000115.1 N-acetyl-1-D-myo-inositol-2-amino-2-deoxy-alpha-D-glucopyranoside deacetylase [Corynebacterium marambiense]MCK7663469.1 N-acetyl-1-D-myo-inositol-2-amino-2-deoxy-alpha-D-glucopyranoside deacetylase [Corynebacterium marambiense]
MRNHDLKGLTVCAVHAHPDDEAIWTGGLLAHLARRGADVTVVTCTLGEQGEVIGDSYQGLVADAADQLGGFRIAELDESLAHLGASGVHLGGAGCWRDSGMAGDPANGHPRAFVNSGDRAVHQLVDIFRSLRPQLVVTYGPDGGYGHPDHVRAHEITHAAVEEMTCGEPAGRVPQRILWAVTDRAEQQVGLDAITRIPEGWRRAAEGELASVDAYDLRIELDSGCLAAKKNAMAAHATQIWFADGSVNRVNRSAAFATIGDPVAAPHVFALSNLIAQPLLRSECYRIGWGSTPAGITSDDPVAGLEFP